MNYALIAVKLPYRHLRNGGLRGLARLLAGLAVFALPGRLLALGRGGRSCPVCDWRGRLFRPYISWSYVTFGAACPSCGSHPRHRGHLLLYERLGLRAMSGDLLYFAPENGVLQYLQAAPGLTVETSNYGTTERAELLKPELSDHNYDLTDIDCADDRWSVIICHRVVEHISDDRRGMEELYRILAPAGLLILSVPISPDLEHTIEFGEPNPLENDHYYRYGMDFQDRIPEQFAVERLAFSEFLSAAERERLSIRDDDYVFLCKKPA